MGHPETEDSAKPPVQPAGEPMRSAGEIAQVEAAAERKIGTPMAGGGRG